MDEDDGGGNASQRILTISLNVGRAFAGSFLLSDMLLVYAFLDNGWSRLRASLRNDDTHNDLFLSCLAGMAIVPSVKQGQRCKGCYANAQRGLYWLVKWVHVQRHQPELTLRLEAKYSDHEETSETGRDLYKLAPVPSPERCAFLSTFIPTPKSPNSTMSSTSRFLPEPKTLAVRLYCYCAWKLLADCSWSVACRMPIQVSHGQAEDERSQRG